MVHLKKFLNSNQKFDFVFGDLTDIPISNAPTGEIWNFIREILEHSFKILKPGGIYLTHVCVKLISNFILVKYFVVVLKLYIIIQYIIHTHTHIHFVCVQGNGANCPESLDMYEEQLKNLVPKVKFSKTKAFVPSFMEDWVFYQVELDV